MGLLDGKHILVTGVLTDASLAFGVAKLAQEEGAEVVLTGVGRGLSLTQRVARKLPQTADVLEFDVTVPEHVVAVRDALATKWGRVDGALHAGGECAPDGLGHVLAAEFGDLLDVDAGEGGELRDGGDERFDGKGGGAVASAGGVGAGDGATRGEQADAGKRSGGGRHGERTDGELRLRAGHDPLGDEFDLVGFEGGLAVGGHELFVVGWEGDAAVQIALFE